MTLIKRLLSSVLMRPSRMRTAVPDEADASVFEPRCAYKKVWNQLSETEERARFSIGGFTEESSYVYTGQVSMQVLERTVGIHIDDRILEIGCGVGRVGYVLAPSCKEWIGCDVSSNMLKFAAKRLIERNNVRFVEISGFDLSPIPDESVDLVYCTVVFMHLDEWDRYNYLLEANRVLKPGGRVYIDNFTLGTDEGWAVFEESRAYQPKDRPSQISKSSTPDEIRVFLEKSGFQSIEVEEDGIWVRGWGVKEPARN